MARKKTPNVTSTTPPRDPWLEAIEDRRAKQLGTGATSAPTPVTEATQTKEVEVE